MLFPCAYMPVARNWGCDEPRGSRSPKVLLGPLSSSLHSANRKHQQTPAPRGRGTERWCGPAGHSAGRDFGSVASSPQATPKVISSHRNPTKPTSPRAPKVAASRNHGAARGKKKRIFPKSRPRAGAVPVRRREERVCGEAAITHKSGRSPGSPCPHRLLGAAIFLPRPPVGRETLPVRHFRRAGHGQRRLWLEVLGARAVGQWGTEGRRPRVLSGSARGAAWLRLAKGTARADGGPVLSVARHPLAGSLGPRADDRACSRCARAVESDGWDASGWPSAKRKWFLGRCLHLLLWSDTALLSSLSGGRTGELGVRVSGSGVTSVLESWHPLLAFWPARASSVSPLSLSYLGTGTTGITGVYIL